jgi:hypothetical protein
MRILIGATWLKVPSIGIFSNIEKIPKWIGRITHWVHASTMANTLTFPAGSILKPSLAKYRRSTVLSVSGQVQLDAKPILVKIHGNGFPTKTEFICLAST